MIRNQEGPGTKRRWFNRGTATAFAGGTAESQSGRDSKKDLLNAGYILTLRPRCSVLLKRTPWPESASELYRPSNRRLSAKLVPPFADRGVFVL
jgi:hypothetical protein